MKNPTAFLATLATVFAAGAFIPANYLLSTTDHLIDYQIFGGVAAVFLLAGLAAWTAYLTVWSVKNPAEASETISNR